MGAFLDGIGQVGGWLDRLAAKKDRADAAVKAVLLAANETRAYIVDWTAGSRARDRELVLVRLWTDAAVAIRRKDPEFAHQLQAKAEYWTDPERWTQADVDRVGIRIDAVAARARSLLGGGM